MADLTTVMLFDCKRAAERDRGVQAAVDAVKRGDLVVMPTDTVYGVGADAFKDWAVTALQNAKGRGRGVPPPVLVGSRSTVDGLVFNLPQVAHDLVEAFWPGGLTMVVEHAPSLQWDLGDTNGTVGLRMPLHPIALEVLRETGPMAVTSANKHGQPSAMNVDGRARTARLRGLGLPGRRSVRGLDGVDDRRPDRRRPAPVASRRDQPREAAYGGARDAGRRSTREPTADA